MAKTIYLVEIIVIQALSRYKMNEGILIILMPSAWPLRISC